MQNASRKDPRVLVAYDSDRPLNMSPEAVALRSYLETESVELLGSQGTTRQTLEDVCPQLMAQNASFFVELQVKQRACVVAGDSENRSHSGTKEHDRFAQRATCMRGCMRVCSTAKHSH